MDRTNQPPTTKDLRQFGLLVGGVFAVIGLWPLVFRNESPRLWAMILGSLLIVLGAIAPQSLKQVHSGWMKIGHILGSINTKIILGIIYYLLITPMGLVMRLMRVRIRCIVPWRKIRTPIASCGLRDHAIICEISFRLSTVLVGKGIPMLSVVMPCRNEGHHIEACVRSILGQERPPEGIEVIIVDGVSDDGTRDILEVSPKSIPN